MAAVPGYPRGERRYHLYTDAQGTTHDLGDDTTYQRRLHAIEQRAGHALSGHKFDNMNGVEGFTYYEQGTDGPTQAQLQGTVTWLTQHGLHP